MRCLFLTLALLLAGCGHGSDTAHTVAGALRFQNGAWRVLEDKGHTSIGIAEVRTHEDGQAEVVFEFQAAKVISFVATTDEVFAAMGAHVGSAVGTESATVHVMIDGDPASKAELETNLSNIWVYGVFEGKRPFE